MFSASDCTRYVVRRMHPLVSKLLRRGRFLRATHLVEKKLKPVPAGTVFSFFKQETGNLKN